MLRDVSREIFRGSLAACSIEHTFAETIKVYDEKIHPQLLIRGAEPIDLGRVKHIRIIAAGKVATAMLSALLTCLRPCKHLDLAGVLIASKSCVDLPPIFQFFPGGHPLPNEASLLGAQAVLKMLRELHSDKAAASETLCLFLISGGASSMMELPLDSSISLTDTISFHRELVHSGATIAEINCVRKHFSAVKGGRLAMVARGIENLSLLVSDVPSNHLDALASGPTLPDTSTVEQCREILARYGLRDRFPITVRRFFDREDLPETSKAGNFVAKHVTLLSSENLAEAARIRAESLGFHTVIDNTCDDWDYRDAASYLLDRLRILREAHPRVCLISSGEITVKLPAIPMDNRHIPIGKGGRNQHFALYAATLLEPLDALTVILSAGSDGIDGNTQTAGGIVDDQTLRPDRFPGEGIESSKLLQQETQAAAYRALQGFDAHTFLEQIGATIVTGATGNNLRDLRIFLGVNA